MISPNCQMLLFFSFVRELLTNVTVAGLEGVSNGITNLALGRLPGAETDRGDRSARVELEVSGRPDVAQSKGVKEK